MNKEIIDRILEILPLMISFLFAVVFFVKGRKGNTSNNYLSFFFFCFVLFHSMSVFRVYLTGRQAGFLIIPFVCAVVALPPTIFYYTNSITIKVAKINILKGYSWTIIFFFLNIISLSTLAYFGSNEEMRKLALYFAYCTAIPPLGIFPILSIYYIYKSFGLIKMHRRDIGDIYSYQKGINLSWVKFFLISFVLFFILVMLNSFTDEYLKSKSIEDIVFNLTVLIYVSFIGVKALQQSTINNALQKAKIEEVKIEKIEEVDSKEESDDSKFKDIRKRLEDYMSSKQPYVDTSLSIYDLAKMIETNYKYLSKTINQEFNQNFVSYINNYRVEEAKNLLKNKGYDNYTIEALAEMSGFKSKSAFNTAFKKQVGITPSEFKNS